jgi:hypothetical protein
MKSKIQPAVKNLTFSVEQTEAFYDPINFPGTAFYYADLSKICSIVNRRFYRQGLNWAVGSIEVYMGGENNSIQINKIPTTWVLSNSWEKVFRAWNKQQKESMADGGSESSEAKFRDFKIFMNKRHLTAHGSRVGELLPMDSEFEMPLEGEWEYSQLVIPNFGTTGNNFEPYIMAVGPHVGGTGGAYSLIELYQESRAVPQSPDPAINPGLLSANNILNLMFDVGDNNIDVLANATGKNNDLPYDQTLYPGGDVNFNGLEIHALEFVTTTTVGNKTTIPGGEFPCGLIEFAIKSDLVPIFRINLVPGNHRGYLAESMTEM